MRYPSRALSVSALACAMLGPPIALSMAPSVAHGYARGIDTADCSGCHTGGRAPMVRIVADPAAPSPGDVVRLRVEIEAVNGSTGGFQMRTSGPGSLRTVGSGTRLVGEDVIVHSAPGTARDGWVRFEVDWLAPATTGDVQLRTGAMSANGDGSSRGDLGGTASLGLVFGCTGATYWRDLDGDGHGATARGSIVACAGGAPEGYASTSDDCDDNDSAEHPGADELCDTNDDDCDGAIDEGLESTTFYLDGDGDGYGRPGGEPVFGCGMAGYGVGDRDCDDRDAAIHPDATEICDGRDTDCDGDVDERVRPVCGVGWCRREAAGCDEAVCEPGDPRAEDCNAFDDDCDGDVDEDVTSCGAGRTCEVGMCVGEGAPRDAGPRADGGARPATSGGCSAGAGADGGPGATLLALLIGLVLRTSARSLRSPPSTSAGLAVVRDLRERALRRQPRSRRTATPRGPATHTRRPGNFGR